MKRYHMIVKGYVQCVGFRYYAKIKAESLGIKGWVRNKYDGTVEIDAEGDDISIELYARLIREGSRYSEVEDVDIKEQELEGYRCFEIEDDN